MCSVWVCVNECHMCAGTYGSQKTSNPLKQQLWVVMSLWLWVLEALLCHYERVTSVPSHLLNHQAISPAPGDSKVEIINK